MSIQQLGVCPHCGLVQTKSEGAINEHKLIPELRESCPGSKKESISITDTGVMKYLAENKAETRAHHGEFIVVGVGTCLGSFPVTKKDRGVLVSYWGMYDSLDAARQRLDGLAKARQFLCVFNDRGLLEHSNFERFC